MPKRYDLIVFDWDGTLMDSTATITRAIQAACRDMQLAVPDDASARHVIGLGLNEALRQVAPDAQEADYPKLADRYRHHFLTQDQEIPLFNGARETVIELHDAGYLLAVATGKSRVGLERVLDNTNMKSYFHATRTADQTFSKPNPTMLLEIMDELDVTPERTLMIGDTSHDVLLAQNAKVDVVAILHGAHPEEHLETYNPLTLVNDIDSLRQWLKLNA